MSIIVGGAGAPSALPPLFLAYDEVGVSGGALSLAPQGESRNNGAAGAFWGTLLGGGHGWAAAGAASATGMVGIRRRTSFGVGVGAKTDFLDWRLGQRWSSSPTMSALVVRLRKFTFECAVSTSGNGPELGIRNVPDALVTANTVLGYSLVPAAGVWTGLRRLTTGAATAAVPVLQSMSSIVARRFKAIYTEGPTPVLEFFLDNLLMFSVSGEANMPELSAAFGITYGPAVAAAGGVSVDTVAASLKMEYL